MGNGESTYDDSHDDLRGHPPSYAGSSDDSHDDLRSHPPSYAGSSEDTYYQHMHQTTSIADDSHDDMRIHPPSYAGSSTDTHHRHKQQSTCIADHFTSLDQVISALREAGLESSNLILGIDFTKSNEWTGKYSFKRKSLHAIGSTPNPYEQAISIIGRTLSPFDEDNLIPCFGFGDATTHDKYVFSFYPDHRYCNGFEEALARYRTIVPCLNLSGSFMSFPLLVIYMHVNILFEMSNLPSNRKKARVEQVAELACGCEGGWATPRVIFRGGRRVIVRSPPRPSLSFSLFLKL
ncbi:E3 ubiquitin-protein ligase RGLG3-like [Corylus avellana]|uniref:E3 ubiquitin-protein ligase RGLG3-like n=1 Tax=Corylus avellana TaxID=13451 RepID=UPI00286A6696|nr:E3 ubiquitin-protein ligase RGLG3-like [Corylus avellana]